MALFRWWVWVYLILDPESCVYSILIFHLLYSVIWIFGLFRFHIWISLSLSLRIYGFSDFIVGSLSLSYISVFRFHIWASLSYDNVHKICICFFKTNTLICDIQFAPLPSLIFSLQNFWFKIKLLLFTFLSNIFFIRRG